MEERMKEVVDELKEGHIRRRMEEAVEIDLKP